MSACPGCTAGDHAACAEIATHRNPASEPCTCSCPDVWGWPEDDRPRCACGHAWEDHHESDGCGGCAMAMRTCRRWPVDRYAETPDLVRSPIIPWRPTQPAALSPEYLEAVDRYLDGDRETTAQQRATR